MKLSLVITMFNRESLLERSLERLTKLTLPDEIIVVNDGGGDGAERVCDEYAERLPIRCIYTHNPQASICSHARNVGIKAARNEWIVTSEPELVYRTDVLKQFTDLHEDHPFEVISAGHVWFANDGWQADEHCSPPIGVQEAVGWVAPFTALWQREWLLAVGGWDESFPGAWGWDDTDLLTRLRHSGIGQHIATDVQAVHQFHGLGADSGSINEEHFLSKGINEDTFTPEALIANKGAEWGIPIPRS